MGIRETRPVALVTGGTGLIGGEVIVELARQGIPVRALVRGASEEDARRRLFSRLEKSHAYRSGIDRLIEPLAGDTTRPMLGTSPEKLRGISVIIHCAANTQFSERESASVWKTNVLGARCVVAAAQAEAPAARLVFVSTASVVTCPEGALVYEHAPFGGHTNAYVRSKREAEAIVQASGLETVILRPSIVLSRGVADRAMARSILWAVPIMSEIGGIPVDADAHIDIVPVDFVAQAITRVALKERLRHAVYHVSAGLGAHSFAELLEAIVRHQPDLHRIQPLGRGRRPSDRARARMLGPLEAYLPFINADVRYATERLEDEIGMSAEAPSALSYVAELVGLISLREAVGEMCRP